jgi:hypothetical protein
MKIDKHKLIGRVNNAKPGEYIPMTKAEMDYFHQWLNERIERSEPLPWTCRED